MNRVGVNRPGRLPSRTRAAACGRQTRVMLSRWTAERWVPGGPTFPGHALSPQLNGTSPGCCHVVGRRESVVMRSRPDEVNLEPVDDPAQRGRQEPTAGPVDEHTDRGG